MLPPEALWEYACRAGTLTPFNVPSPISRAVVNFDAAVPSGLAQSGEESKTTVPVKSMPPNAWGLHEMHGNVWEWCADGQRDYARTANLNGVLENPLGPQEHGPEALRAVRGGSWIRVARCARSAYRARQRQDRSLNPGFRFALRSRSPETPEGVTSADDPAVPQRFFCPARMHRAGLGWRRGAGRPAAECGQRRGPAARARAPARLTATPSTTSPSRWGCG